MSNNVIRIAAAVICRNDGRMLLVRKRGTECFMQPGGKIEPDESPLTALQRKLLEELGITLDHQRFSYVGRYTAAAANEPGKLVDAEVFRVEISLPVIPCAEIEEIIWLAPLSSLAMKLAPLTRDELLTLCFADGSR